MAWLSRFRSDGDPPKNWVRHVLVVLITLAVIVATFKQIVGAEQLAEKENVVVCNVVGGCNPGPFWIEALGALSVGLLLVCIYTITVYGPTRL